MAYCLEPLLSPQKGGHDIQAKRFIQTIYCAALRIPQDATVHLVGASEGYVAETFRQVRFVCAWQQTLVCGIVMSHVQDTLFPCFV